MAAEPRDREAATGDERGSRRTTQRSVTELAIMASTQAWSGSWSPRATVVVA